MKSPKPYLVVNVLMVASLCSSAWATTITTGQTATGTIASAAQIGVYTFTASAGEVVDLTMTATSGSLAPKIQLYNPLGTLISTANPGNCDSTVTEMNTVLLSTAGTYTVDVSDCTSTNTGNYALYFQSTNDPGGANGITFGSTAADTIGSAAQDNTYTFSANANDVLDMTMTGTGAKLAPRIRLYSPSGTLLSSAVPGNCDSTVVEMDTVTLPVTGTYTVLVGDCTDTQTGGYDLYAQLTDAPTDCTSLVFGQTVSGMIAADAQSNTYCFSASASDVIDFTMTATSGNLAPKIRVYTESTGELLGSAVPGNCDSTVVELDTLTITATGTYAVLVGDCTDTYTGNYEFYSQRTNNPSGALPLPYGQTQTGSISSAAQNNTYTLSASAGDVLDFTMTATSGNLAPKIRLYNPNGTLNKSAVPGNCDSTVVEMDAVTLPSTGTYTVLVGDCTDTQTGNYGVYVQRINNPSGASSVLWEQLQSGAISPAAQSSTYTFVGTSGNVVDFTMTATSGNLAPRIRLYNPDATLNATANPGNCDSTVTQLNSVALSQSGTYTMLLGDCTDAYTGNYNLTSQCFSNCPLPAPTLASISPTNVLEGSGGFTLTVNGTNFVNVAANSVVDWNGTVLTTTWVSTFQMTAAVPAGYCATANTALITVFTPAPGGGTSNSQTFTCNNPLPTTGSPLSPASAIAGGGAITLTVTGTNFVPTSSVNWNGSSLVTTYLSATSLQAAVPASDCANGGTDTVTVSNPTPGGGTSNSQTFTCNNPSPTTSSPLSPASATAGSGTFTLTVTGTGFDPSSSVKWNASSLETTYVSPTELQAAVPASDCANGGTDTVAVFNPTPGGGTSNSQTFTCNNPVPTTTSPLSPASVIVGGPAFTLTVTGTNFVPSSQVMWNGNSLAITSQTATQLQATVPATDCTAAGPATITVLNPTPGGGTSNSQTFTCNNPVPATASLSPTSAPVGGPAFTLTVNGSNFVQSSTVNWNGGGLATTYISATQLTATVPATDCATISANQVTVTSPTPGGGTSSPALTFSCETRTPVMTSPTPDSTLAGSSVTFTWDPVYQATGYALWVGTTGTGSGSDNLYYSGEKASTVTSLTVGGLPVNGETIYVRLIAYFSTTSTFTTYTYTSVTGGILTTPAPSSTLAGPSVSFGWTAGANATGYALWIGSTGPGSDNLYYSDEQASTVTSLTVNGLPTNGETIYVRLITYYGSSSGYIDYTYTSATAAVLTMPAPGTTLTGPNATFSWTVAANATGYALWIGSTPTNADNLYYSGEKAPSVTSLTVGGLPVNGETIYVRLLTYYGSASTYTTYTYTSVTGGILTMPAPGSTLAGPSVTFSWTAGANATGYALWIGDTGPGSDNLYYSGEKASTVTSLTVSGLPVNGETIYVRLITYYGGNSGYINYTYTALSAAVLTSPTPGSTLAGPSVTFSWSSAAGATGYALWAGTTGTGSGSDDLFYSGEQASSVNSLTASGLPVNGETIYLRLITYHGSNSAFITYTYTSATGAILTTPAPSSTLTSPSVTFTWTPGAGATGYALWIGSTGTGSDNLYYSGEKAPTVTSLTVNGLPTNGETIYVRLITYYGSSIGYINYTYTAESP